MFDNDLVLIITDKNIPLETLRMKNGKMNYIEWLCCLLLATIKRDKWYHQIFLDLITLSS